MNIITRLCLQMDNEKSVLARLTQIQESIAPKQAAHKHTMEEDSLEVIHELTQVRVLAFAVCTEGWLCVFQL